MDRSLRACKEPFRQRTKIESGPSDKNGKPASLAQILKYGARLALIIPGVEFFVRLPNVDHVVLHAPTFFGARLRRTDIHMAKDLNGIVIDNLTVERFGDGKRQIGLPAGRRSDNGDDGVWGDRGHG